MTTGAVHLNVLISGGFSIAYERLLPEFERASGIDVTTGSGASQGTGPQTIAAQLARGVAADVVILSREGLTELIAAKRIIAGTDVDLARAQLIRDLREDFGVNDEGVSVILHLVDQMHGLRRSMQGLIDEMRARYSSLSP